MDLKKLAENVCIGQCYGSDVEFDSQSFKWLSPWFGDEPMVWRFLFVLFLTKLFFGQGGKSPFDVRLCLGGVL